MWQPAQAGDWPVGGFIQPVKAYLLTPRASEASVSVAAAGAYTWQFRYESTGQRRLGQQAPRSSGPASHRPGALGGDDYVRGRRNSISDLV